MDNQNILFLVFVGVIIFIIICDNTNNDDIFFLRILYRNVNWYHWVKCAMVPNNNNNNNCDLILDFVWTFFLASFAFKHVQKLIPNNSIDQQIADLILWTIRFIVGFRVFSFFKFLYSSECIHLWILHFREYKMGFIQCVRST